MYSSPMMSDGTEQELSFFGANAGLSCGTSEDCAENEVCIKNSKKLERTCECTRGYKRNLAGNNNSTVALSESFKKCSNISHFK